MGAMVSGKNVSRAWLRAYQILLERGRGIPNLAVTIEQPLTEDSQVRQVLDRFIREKRSRNQAGGHRPELVSTVANTIFPRSLYIPRLGAKARAHLYKMSGLGRPVSRRRNHRGTYFERLVAWPTGNGSINQLEIAIRRIKNARRLARNNENALELAVTGPNDFAETGASEEPSSLAIYGAEFDSGITRGFPCLSHISLSLVDGKLHMAAVYRNHEFVSRAYGNYLGLGWLLEFIAHESGCEVGELMCVSSHADPEIGHGAGFGLRALKSLVQECEAAASESTERRATN